MPARLRFSSASPSVTAALVTAAGVARSLVRHRKSAVRLPVPVPLPVSKGGGRAPRSAGERKSPESGAVLANSGHALPAATAKAAAQIAVAPGPVVRSGPVDLGPIIRRVRAGDEDAARQLMDHLYPMVLSVVRGHLPRRMGEDDLTQMVFAKVFTKLDQFAGKVPLEHWVSRIAVNTCLNALQAEKIRPEFRWADLSVEEEHVVSSLVATSGELDPDQEVGARDLVGKLLDTLRPAERLLLTMLHMEGRSVAEIRACTGWNASLIKVRAFRARQRLKQQFKRLMQERASTL